MRKIAVITGATSGLGAAYAKRLAAQGYDLIITGRRREIVNKVANDISNQYKTNVKVIIAELSDDKDVQTLIDTIKNTENIEILINNAGYGNFKYFCDMHSFEYEQMTKVLAMVPMKLISAVLPQMINRRDGIIINVASSASIIPGKKNSVYCANKAFIKIFSECLHLELHDKGIKIQALLAGAINTDFHGNSHNSGTQNRYRIYNAMSPEGVVNYSLKCLKKNRVICIPGASFRVIIGIFSFFPKKIWYKIENRN